jgi:hypothetical protein
VYWRPWAPHAVFVTNNVFVAQRNVIVQPYHRVPESQRQPIVQSRVAPAFPQQQRHEHRGDSRRDAARQQQRSGRS